MKVKLLSLIFLVVVILLSVNFKIYADEPSPWCHTFNNNFSQGSRSRDVPALQNILIKEGFLKIAGPSDYFGNATRAALISYQNKYGILQTGTVGPKTRIKINSVYGCSNKPASNTPPKSQTVENPVSITKTVSPSVVHATIPAQTPATVTPKITVPVKSPNAPNIFYITPTVISSGKTIVVTGSNFTPDTVIRFNQDNAKKSEKGGVFAYPSQLNVPFSASDYGILTPGLYQLEAVNSFGSSNTANVIVSAPSNDGSAIIPDPTVSLNVQESPAGPYVKIFNWNVKNADGAHFTLANCPQNVTVKESSTGNTFSCEGSSTSLGLSSSVTLIFTNKNSEPVTINAVITPFINGSANVAFKKTVSFTIPAGNQ